MAKKISLLQRLPLAPVIAVMFGAAAAALVAAIPQWRFESLIAASNLSSVLSVATPPLGLKARLLAVFVAFAIAALVTSLAVAAVERMLAGPSPLREDDDELDLTGYAQALASPDTPRRPIFADRELGAPLMSDAALATATPLILTEDLPDETVAFEPEVAADPVLQAPLEIAEFDLPSADDFAPHEGESTIDALIRRLEAGMARRGSPERPDPSTPAAAPAAASPRDWMVREEPSNDRFDEDATRALGTLRALAAR